MNNNKENMDRPRGDNFGEDTYPSAKKDGFAEDDFLAGLCPYDGSTEPCESCQ